jgi:hypothetical protein
MVEFIEYTLDNDELSALGFINGDQKIKDCS